MGVERAIKILVLILKEENRA